MVGSRRSAKSEEAALEEEVSSLRTEELESEEVLSDEADDADEGCDEERGPIKT